MDEAGRGPVIGPLVVAGVCIEDANELARIGVKDSKECTPGRRELLRARIMGLPGMRASIRRFDAEQIDASRERRTLNVTEAGLFAEVISDLGPDVAYVDAADTSESRFANEIRRRLPDRLRSLRIVSRHKADSMFPVVSAASILAKTERDSCIRGIAEELHEDIGSGYPSDPVTRGFLEKWIRENGKLPPHTRRTWQTVRTMRARTGMVRMSLLDYGGRRDV